MRPEEKTAATVTEARPDELDAKVEALLFASEVPLPAKHLAELTVSRSARVLEAIDRLNVFYGESRRAFRIVPIAGGFQLATTTEHGALLGKLRRDRVPTRLSQAALETLSIIAFKQPVTRAEIDSIRGVSASDGVLRHLLERKLVRISGRAEAPGRPLLYATTREFLAAFGLSSVSDLPRTDELAALLKGAAPPEPAQEEPAPGMMEGPGTRAEPEDFAGPEAGPGGEDPGRIIVSHSGEESDEHGGIPSP
jgi:segregation and condensation protein B